MSYQQIDTPQPISLSDPHQHATSPPTTTMQPQQQQPTPASQAAAAEDLLHLPTIGLFQDHCCKIYMSFSGPHESFKNN